MENISVFCDGGSRGNPGPAAIGFLVRIGKRIIYKHSEFIGKATNNIAEYTAVLKALQWLIKNCQIVKLSNCQIVFYLDSQLVVQQLKGSFKIKSPQLKNLAIKIKSLEKKLANLLPGRQSKIFYKKIPRQENKLADSLVNFALGTSIN